MSDPLDPPQATAPLRQQAVQKLRAGEAQLSSDFTASADALGVLYRLSSEASTASDALKLLHELQIHQVELELQLEQLQANERETSHDLACFQQFFCIAPLACFIVNLDGIVTDSNAAAIRFFEPLIKHDAKPVIGRSLVSLFSTSCHPMLNATFARVQRNQQQASLIVSTATNSATQEHVQLTISLSPDHQAILVILTKNSVSLPARPQSQSPCE